MALVITLLFPYFISAKPSSSHKRDRFR